MIKPIKYVCYSAITLALLIPHVATQAQDLPSLTWSDRLSKETTDGEVVEAAPYAKIGTIRLSRFSQMQALTLQDTLTIGEGDDVETLFVFRAWQGGASQGEQLMLVTASSDGIDVIGPYKQDFEKLTLKPEIGEFGPIFELYGADKDESLARLEYFNGQLLALRDE